MTPAPVPTYAPLRQQIADALALDERDQETITELCILVASLAHGEEAAWLQQQIPVLGEEDARQILEDVREGFADAIASVREVSHQLEAHLLACGLSAPDAVAGVNVQLGRELFELPGFARWVLGR
jgi:hypothetical protein